MRREDIFYAVVLLSGILLCILGIFVFVVGSVDADENNIILNAWAQGMYEEDGCPGNIHDGWTHSETVTLSRCPKNPAPSGDPNDDGSAFKNGPVNGLGTIGVETSSTQSFSLPESDGYTFNFSSLVICVRCDYLEVDLYGDDVYLGSLLSFHNGSESCDNSEKWPRYCGDDLSVGYYETYTIDIRSMYTASDALGVKWTGLELYGNPIGDPAPPTPEPTQTPNVYNLSVGEVLDLTCPGELIFLGDSVHCAPSSSTYLPSIESGR